MLIGLRGARKFCKINKYLQEKGRKAKNGWGKVDKCKKARASEDKI